MPVVPIYIQEKIQPQALIENLRDTARKGEPEPEMTLFNDYNGIEFQELVEFYRHEQNWSNRMILGDSLLVMTSLAEKEGLKGKVQMIYMDPPYGIKFGSNWQVSTRKRDVKDGKAEDATRQPEQIKAFRDTWELGIHSYLAYLRDRLTVARELLTESGSIFVQIGDENVHLVRCVMDEVFGAENFVCHDHASARRRARRATPCPALTDYILWYAKQPGRGQVPAALSRRRHSAGRRLGVHHGSSSRRHSAADDCERARRPDVAPGRRPALRARQPDEPERRPREGRGRSLWFPVDFDGQRATRPTCRAGGRRTRQGMAAAARGRPHCAWSGTRSGYVRYLDDFPAFPLTNNWDDTAVSQLRRPKVYVVQTNTKVIQRCMLMTTDPGDLVLDPTCGSGTHSLRRGAVGPPLDHRRHQPRRPRARAHAPDGRALPVLPARGLARGRARRGRADRPSRRRPRPLAATSARASSTSASRTSPSSRSPRTPTSTRACRARRSTPPSPATPTPSCSTTSPTRTTSASA